MHLLLVCLFAYSPIDFVEIRVLYYAQQTERAIIGKPSSTRRNPPTHYSIGLSPPDFISSSAILVYNAFSIMMCQRV